MLIEVWKVRHSSEIFRVVFIMCQVVNSILWQVFSLFSSIELISNLHSSNISFSLLCENACYSVPSMQPGLANDQGQMLVSISEGSGIKFIFVLYFYKHTGFCICPSPATPSPAPSLIQTEMLWPPIIQSYCPWFNFGLFSILSPTLTPTPTPTPTLWDLGGISRAVWHSLEPRKLVFTAPSHRQNTKLFVIVFRNQQCFSCWASYVRGGRAALLLVS